MTATRPTIAASATANGLPRYVDVAEFRQALVMADRTFRRALSAGRIPKPDLRLGRAMRWRVETVREFLESLEAKTRSGNKNR